MKALSALFAERLRAWRLRLDWTQQELADRSGVPRVRVDEYEHARHLPSADALKRLAEALKCSTDYLLGVESIVAPGALQDLGRPLTPLPAESTLADAQALAQAQGKTWVEYQGKAYALRRNGWEQVV